MILAGCAAANGAEVAAHGSPLDEFLNPLWGTGYWDENLSEEERQRRFQAERTEIENLVAECMHEAGFTYIPFPEGHSLVFASEDEWRPNDRDWVMQQGYG